MHWRGYNVTRNLVGGSLMDDAVSFLIFVVVVAAIVAIPLVIFRAQRYDHARREASIARRFTAHATGVVTAVSKPLVQGEPTVVTVRYEADGREYTLREHLKVTAEGVEAGGFIVNVKKNPAMSVSVGDVVEVAYDPTDPARAALVANEGLMEA